MTIFSGRIRYCGHTNVFVSLLEDGRCSTVVSVDLCLAGSGALFFPVPAETGTAENAFEFLDLRNCQQIFEQLDLCFRDAPDGEKPSGKKNPIQVSRQYLVSDESGFEQASSGLRLNTHVMNSLPMYWNWPFAAAEILTDSYVEGRLLVGYTYVPVHSSEMFYPVVCVLGNEIHPIAEFDHTLYFQQNSDFGIVRGWEVGHRRPGVASDLNQLGNVVHPAWPLQRCTLFGNLPNCDYVLQSCRFVEAEVRSPFDLQREEGQGRKLWELLPDEEQPEAADASESTDR